jgi:transposase
MAAKQLCQRREGNDITFRAIGDPMETSSRPTPFWIRAASRSQLTPITRLKYACDCTIKTADKPPQPIEKSTTGASLLAQVIVSKFADHQPLHRQEKIFERHGVEISRKTMRGWMSSVADPLNPLYQAGKRVLFESKVIGTDDTGVKVLDRKLPFARTGRIWPYVGDGQHEW